MRRNILSGRVPHEPFDCQHLHTGRIQAGRKCVPTPVRRYLRRSNLLCNGLEIGPVAVGGYGVAVIAAYDGIAATGKPGHQIRLDFGVDRNDPVLPGFGFSAALEVIPVRMVGKAGEGQKF